MYSSIYFEIFYVPDTILEDKIYGYGEKIEYTRFDNSYNIVSWRQLNNIIVFHLYVCWLFLLPFRS